MTITHFLETLSRDARVSLRGFRRTPSFALVTIAILVLGIGMTIAMTSVYNAILLRPLPVTNQERIVLPRAFDRAGVEYAEWPDNVEAFRKSSRTLANVAGVVHWGATDSPFLDGDRSIALKRALVTGNFFDVLGARPVLGRLLRPSDDEKGSPYAIVLSYATWMRQFHGDSSVIGKRLVGTYFHWDYPIVGVAPPGLDYPAGVEYWQTIAPMGRALMSMVGRLRPGATPSAAASEYLTWRRTTDNADHNQLDLARSEAPTFARVVLGDVATLLHALGVAVVLLLVIACFNVGNLLLVRGAARSNELSIRRALGASDAAIIQQMLMESAMLALVAGLLGLLAAQSLIAALVRLAPDQLPRVDVVGVDRVSVRTAIGVSVAALLLFGLAPAFHAARSSMALSLRADARGGDSSRRKRNVRQWLVASQIGLAMILLAGAGLLVRSLDHLRRLDLGYQPEHLSLFQVAVPQADDPGTDAGKARFYAHGQQILDRLRALPGIVSVTPVLMATPFRGTDTFVSRLRAEGTAVSDPSTEFVPWEDGDRDLFRTLGVQIVRGRGFLDTDDERAAKVVVVSERFAKRHWGTEDPVGKRVIAGDDTTGLATVVGVARDVRFRRLRESTSTVFYPWRQQWWQGAFAIRTNVELAAVAPAMRRAAREVDSQLSMWSEQSMDELLGEPLAQPRYGALLLAVFGIAALALAAIGLYGVMSAIVRERARELGVRMALGATPEQVRVGVLSGAFRVAIVGAGAGLVVALMAGRLLSTLLFEVSPTDPLTLFVVAALLVTTTMLAAYIPARRATKIDPMLALRGE